MDTVPEKSAPVDMGYSLVGIPHPEGQPRQHIPRYIPNPPPLTLAPISKDGKKPEYGNGLLLLIVPNTVLLSDHVNDKTFFDAVRRSFTFPKNKAPRNLPES